MVKLECRDRACIAALDACTTRSRYEVTLPLTASLAPVSRPRLKALKSHFSTPVVWIGTRSKVRRVVGAKRRAAETESPSVKIAHDAIDNRFRRESTATGLAGLLFWHSCDLLPWPAQSTKWQAIEAPRPAPEVYSLTVDHRVDREFHAALLANQHSRTLVLSREPVYSRPRVSLVSSSSAPAGGFEPPTKGLTVPCATVALRRKETRC